MAKKKILRSAVLALVGGAVMVSASGAAADVIVSFSGTVDLFNHGPFTPHSAIYGQVVLDSGVIASGSVNTFNNVISSFQLTIAEPGNSLTYGGSGGRVQQFASANGATEFISLGLGGVAGGSLTGPTFNNFTPTRFHIDFRGADLFTVPTQLAEGLDQTDFFYSFLTFTLSGGSGQSFMVERRLDTVSFSGTSAPSAVPAPGAFALLVLGMASLVGLRRARG